MSIYSPHWKEITELLREARVSLAPERHKGDSGPVPVGLLTGTLDEVDEFLDHNQLELAWDALAAMADHVNAPPSCWHKLVQAANLMGLSAKEAVAARHAAPTVSCDQALAIARLDAEKAYRDLSPYRIQIVLEPDGWHVDYELKDPRLNGGGPHYVIDARNGEISSKRYEQ